MVQEEDQAQGGKKVDFKPYSAILQNDPLWVVLICSFLGRLVKW